MELLMDEILEIFGKGFIIGILFSNITILVGWGVRQLMIFFKTMING